MAQATGTIYNENGQRAMVQNLMNILVAGNKIQITTENDDLKIKIENTIYDYIKDFTCDWGSPEAANGDTFYIRATCVIGNVETPLVWEIQSATLSYTGLMNKASVQAILDLQRQIATIHGGTILLNAHDFGKFLDVADTEDTDTLTAYAKSQAGENFQHGTSVDNLHDSNLYVWQGGQYPAGKWTFQGANSSVPVGTNDTETGEKGYNGIVHGKSEDGKIYIENNGLMSVWGWDKLTGRVTALEAKNNRAIGDFPRPVAYTSAFDKNNTYISVIDGETIDLDVYTGFTANDVGRAYTFINDLRSNHEHLTGTPNIKFNGKSYNVGRFETLILILREVVAGRGFFNIAGDRYAFGKGGLELTQIQAQSASTDNYVCDDSIVLRAPRVGDNNNHSLNIAPYRYPFTAFDSDIGRSFLVIGENTENPKDRYVFYYVDIEGKNQAHYLKNCESCIVTIVQKNGGGGPYVWRCVVSGQSAGPYVEPDPYREFASNLNSVLTTDNSIEKTRPDDRHVRIGVITSQI